MGDTSAEVVAAVNEIIASLEGKRVISTDNISTMFAGNVALMQQAISTFVQTTLATAGKIDAALSANDWDSLSRVAHQNKGSASYMGAERVVAIALQVQADAKELLSSSNAAKAEGREPPSASVLTLARCETLKRCLCEMAEHLAAMTEK